MQTFNNPCIFLILVVFKEFYDNKSLIKCVNLDYIRYVKLYLRAYSQISKFLVLYLYSVSYLYPNTMWILAGRHCIFQLSW